MRKDFLHNKVIREILSQIFTGGYAQGQKLPSERSLCTQFSVSRGTLRQALADLERLAVIKIKPGSGAYVQDVSRARLPHKLLPPDFHQVTVADVIVARQAIETTAVELACDHITPPQRQTLAECIDKMAAAVGDLPEFLRYDMQFHQTLVKATGNRVLVTAFDAIYEYHKYSQIFTSLEEGDEQLALDFHRQIFDALRQKNKKRARKIITRHLDSIIKYSLNP